MVIYYNHANTQHRRKMMMANKNPFEIRAEMLTLAKDYMDQQYYMNKEFAEKMFDAGQKSMEDVQEAFKMYSVEDLMEKAKEMYSFVSKKD
jgi:hypothetical protein